MKTWLAFALAAVVLGIAACPAAQAAVVRPWCEQSSAFGSGPDCSYATFAQCMATARGDGDCLRNPAFDWPYFKRGIPAPEDTDPYGRPLRTPRRR
jgi:hypothetical protein